MLQPERRRREGQGLPDVWRSIIPCFRIFSVFLVFLNSLVFCVVSTVLRVRCYLHLRWYYYTNITPCFHLWWWQWGWQSWWWQWNEENADSEDDDKYGDLNSSAFVYCFDIIWIIALYCCIIPLYERSTTERKQTEIKQWFDMYLYWLLYLYLYFFMITQIVREVFYWKRADRDYVVIKL